MTLVATIFVDADNTLWDTDRLFADAQLRMLDRVSEATGLTYEGEDRLSFVRSIDQAIAERHHDNLRYPPRLLALGLSAALGGLSPKRAGRRAMLEASVSVAADLSADDLEREFFAGISATPSMRPGVVEGLAWLKRKGHRLFVITEGSRPKAERILETLDLSKSFERLIEGRKRPDLYQRIARLAGMPELALMVGDQLDRDIAPAKAAGLRTVYFPGGFTPHWTPDEDTVAPDYRIENFAELTTIVEQLTTARRVEST